MKKEYSLEPILPRDFNKFHLLFKKNRERLIRYFPNTVEANKTEEESLAHLLECEEQRMNKEKYLFGIYDSDLLIGYVNVKNIEWDIPKCELGYFIDVDYEGMGIMSNHVKKVLCFCFEELRMVKIFLRIAEENVGSKIVARKVGFVKEGLLRNEFRIETGDIIDVEYYGLISSDKFLK